MHNILLRTEGEAPEDARAAGGCWPNYGLAAVRFFCLTPMCGPRLRWEYDSICSPFSGMGGFWGAPPYAPLHQRQSAITVPWELPGVGAGYRGRTRNVAGKGRSSEPNYSDASIRSRNSTKGHHAAGAGTDRGTSRSNWRRALKRPGILPCGKQEPPGCATGMDASPGAASTCSWARGLWVRVGL